MGKSADLLWTYVPGNDENLYSPCRGGNGKLVDRVLLFRLNLSGIVHEINECELSHLLQRLGVGDRLISLGKPSHEKPKKTFLSHNRKKFPGLFTGQHTYSDEIYLTHMISPYGHSCCFMPRGQNRIRWDPVNPVKMAWRTTAVRSLARKRRGKQ